MELEFSSDSFQHFNCQTCREGVKRVRKCQDDRWDHTFKKDGAAFPMAVFKGGTEYGFCPGKAQWYPYLRNIYDMFVVCCELGKLPYDGAIMEQPTWVITNLAWFSRVYNKMAGATRSGMAKFEKSPKVTVTGPPADNGVNSASKRKRSGIHNKSRRD